jgi:hypothetical protein
MTTGRIAIAQAAGGAVRDDLLPETMSLIASFPPGFRASNDLSG